MTDAALETDGLERRLLRRGTPESACREKADEWANKQPWRDRIVTKKCTSQWWVWFLTPESGR